MSEKINIEGGQNEENYKESKIKKGALFVGKVAAGTVIVCLTATPFVYNWAEKISESVDPVKGTLEEVNKTVGEGSNVIGSSIKGLTTEVDDLTPEASTTTTLDESN